MRPNVKKSVTHKIEKLESIVQTTSLILVKTAAHKNSSHFSVSMKGLCFIVCAYTYTFYCELRNPTFDFFVPIIVLIMNYCCVLKEWPFISDWSQLSESFLNCLARAKLVFWPCTAVKWTSKDELDAKNGINNKNKRTSH